MRDPLFQRPRSNFEIGGGGGHKTFFLLILYNFKNIGRARAPPRGPQPPLLRGPCVCRISVIIIYKLDDVDISRNLVGSLSLANEQLFTEVEVNRPGYSPSHECGEVNILGFSPTLR